MLLALILLRLALPVCSQTPDAFSPNPNDQVNAMAVQADGKIVVGGYFTQLAGYVWRYVGRLNPDGTFDTTFSYPGLDYAVFSLAVQLDGRIPVVGWFVSPASYITRLNGNGTVDTTFSALGARLGNPSGVYGLAAQADGKIVVGGAFTQLGGGYRNNIGRLNTIGLLDTNFTASANGWVYPLILQADGKVLLGGAFTTLNGQVHSCIGRLYSDGTLDTNFNAAIDSTPVALTVQADGNILVGGGFTNLCGQPRNRIGRLNADGTLDTAFDPGADGVVRTLVLQADGKILVGGEFTTLAGQPCSRLGRLNANGTLDTMFNAGTDGTVYGVTVQADGKVLVGGTFATLGGQSRTNMGRLNNTDPATQSLTCDGSVITWLRGGTSPEVWQTSFEASTNGTEFISLGNGTRISGGWQLTGLSLPPNSTIRARGFVASGRYNGSGWFAETLSGPPAILTQPVSLAFSPGTTATFSVLAVGTLPLAYQWQLTGTNIAGATNSSLTLTNAQLTNNGSYDVVVTNLYGSITSSVAALGQPPLITSQPQDQTVVAGADVGFAATAIGSDPLTYQWYFNGTPLEGATNSSLLLSGVSLSKVGVYSVTVSNLISSVSSRNAALVVPNTGSCIARPSGLVSWWAADGTALDSVSTNNGVLQGAVSCAKGLVGVALSFDGVSSFAIVPDSDSLRLTTQLTIEAWINPRSVNANRGIVSKVGGAGGAFGYQFLLQGNTLVGQFNDFGQGWPSAKIQSVGLIAAGVWSHVAWTYDQSAMKLYLNGQPVKTNAIGPRSIAASSSRLRISGDDNDSAPFDGLIDEVSLYSRALSGSEIAAIYNAGTAGKCAPQPVVLTPPQSLTVPARANVGLTVVAAGMPPLNYQWRKNGSSLDGATSTSLTLTNLRLTDTGSYDVLVTNVIGSVTSAVAVLTVKALTILPTDGTFGFRSNQFGFDISGSAGWVVVVESSTNLVNWTALASNTMGSDQLSFYDAASTNFTCRFYRVQLQ
jgi:uncharacterized delta-60 repeat protein